MMVNYTTFSFFGVPSSIMSVFKSLIFRFGEVVNCGDGGLVDSDGELEVATVVTTGIVADNPFSVAETCLAASSAFLAFYRNRSAKIFVKLTPNLNAIYIHVTLEVSSDQLRAQSSDDGRRVRLFAQSYQTLWVPNR